MSRTKSERIPHSAPIARHKSPWQKFNPVSWLRAAISPKYNNKIFFGVFLIPFLITGYLFTFHPQYGIGSAPELRALIQKIDSMPGPFEDDFITPGRYKIPTDILLPKERGLGGEICLIAGQLFTGFFWWATPVFGVIAFRDEVIAAWKEHRRRKASGKSSSIFLSAIQHMFFERIPIIRGHK